MITMDVISIDLLPTDFPGIYRKHLQTVANENIRAIGTGLGGAGNQLPHLEASTIRKKGHGRQIYHTGDLRSKIAFQSHGKGGDIRIAPSGSPPRSKVARWLITGKFENSKGKKFQFFGVRGLSHLAPFIRELVEDAAYRSNNLVDPVGLQKLMNGFDNIYLDTAGASPVEPKSEG